MSALDGIDYENPLHRAIFKDVCKNFSDADPDSLLRQIDLYRSKQFSELQGKNKISIDKLYHLLMMS